LSFRDRFFDACDECIFDALADGGRVTMPLAESFWAKAFGMVIDRFGTPWMVNGASAPM